MMNHKKVVSRGLLLAAGAIFVVGGFLGTAVFWPAPEATGGWIYVKGEPSLTISPTPVPYKRKVKVTIAGSGFEPNQEVELHIVMGGVPSDISGLVKPEPEPNEYGAFMVQWTLNREIRAKLLEPTAYTLEAVDENGTVLAHAPLAFVEEKKEKKKK